MSAGPSGARSLGGAWNASHAQGYLRFYFDRRKKKNRSMELVYHINTCVIIVHRAGGSERWHVCVCVCV